MTSPATNNAENVCSDRDLILIQRDDYEAMPMSASDRNLSRMKHVFYQKPTDSADVDADADADVEKDEEAQDSSKHANTNRSAGKKQYRVTWHKSKMRSLGRCTNLADFMVRLFSINEKINDEIISSLDWCFRSSFAKLIGVFILVFFGFAVFFALLIWIASDSYPECLSTKKDESYWQDSFALSWTTFSTVGYGHIYPALAEGNEQSTTCGWIYSICAIEAFVGVLYAGICAAILFSKIYRIQAYATVDFSKAITIRYGGIHQAVEDEKNLLKIEESLSERIGTYTEKSISISEQTLACPVMSIMMVNTLANKVTGGELINASVSGVVTKKANFSTDSKVESNNSGGLFRRKKKAKQMNTLKAISTVCDYDHLSFIQSNHFLFNRVWIVEHVLDENSPLLKKDVRDRILLTKKGNVSAWPDDLATANGVRESLEPFENLVLSFKATSNASASAVYAHQVYDYKSSIVVGYQHAEIAFIDNFTKAVGIDLELIDDIVESGDGSGEDLSKFVSID